MYMTCLGHPVRHVNSPLKLSGQVAYCTICVHGAQHLLICDQKSKSNVGRMYDEDTTLDKVHQRLMYQFDTTTRTGSSLVLQMIQKTSGLTHEFYQQPAANDDGLLSDVKDDSDSMTESEPEDI